MRPFPDHVRTLLVTICLVCLVGCCNATGARDAVYAGVTIGPVPVDASDYDGSKQTRVYIIQLDNEALGSFALRNQHVKNSPLRPSTTLKPNFDHEACHEHEHELRGQHASFAFSSALHLRSCAQARPDPSSTSSSDEFTPPPLHLIHTYIAAYHGVSVQLSADEAECLASHPDVVAVHAATHFVPNVAAATDATSASMSASVDPLNPVRWSDGVHIADMGAPEVWRGVADLDPFMGEGVVIGVIDLGVMIAHKLFGPVGGDGYEMTNPLGKMFGQCDVHSVEYNPDLIGCDNKTIGYWDYLIDDPTDRNVHGTHVAGLAAGNIYSGPAVDPTGAAMMVNMSGVAPHANIISYRVGGGELFPADKELAAYDQALLDGVDVINLSLGSFPHLDDWRTPWQIPLPQGTRALRAAGIHVQVGLANSGPFPFTASAHSVAPWVIGVGSVDVEHRCSLFSSVGPVGRIADPLPLSWIKPDVASYGNGELSASVPTVYTFEFESGTSMATPMTSGAAILIASLRPDWTPAELQSALMLTAHSTRIGEIALLQGRTPEELFVTVPQPRWAHAYDQYGAGVVNIPSALMSGLVLDIDESAYIAADPATGGLPSEMNLASFAQYQCPGVCQWTRTFRATIDATWDVSASVPWWNERPVDELVVFVSPSSFTLSKGQIIELVVNVTSTAPQNAYLYANITLVPRSPSSSPSLSMPLAIRNTLTSLSPPRLEYFVPTEYSQGRFVIENIVSPPLGTGDVEQGDTTVYGLRQDEVVTLDNGELVYRVLIPDGASYLALRADWIRGSNNNDLAYKGVVRLGTPFLCLPIGITQFEDQTCVSLITEAAFGEALSFTNIDPGMDYFVYLWVFESDGKGGNKTAIGQFEASFGWASDTDPSFFTQPTVSVDIAATVTPPREVCYPVDRAPCDQGIYLEYVTITEAGSSLVIRFDYTGKPAWREGTTATRFGVHVGSGVLPSVASSLFNDTAGTRSSPGSVVRSVLKNLNGLEAGDYWILIHLREGEAGTHSGYLGWDVIPPSVGSGDEMTSSGRFDVSVQAGGGTRTLRSPTAVDVSQLDWSVDYDVPGLQMGQTGVGFTALTGGGGTPDLGSYLFQIKRSDGLSATLSSSPTFFVSSGQIITYTITVAPTTSTTSADSLAIVTFVPEHTTYVRASATASYGSVSYESGKVSWQEMLSDETPLIIEYQVVVEATTPFGTEITSHISRFSDQAAYSVTLTVTDAVPTELPSFSSESTESLSHSSESQSQSQSQTRSESGTTISLSFSFSGAGKMKWDGVAALVLMWVVVLVVLSVIS